MSRAVLMTELHLEGKNHLQVPQAVLRNHFINLKEALWSIALDLPRILQILRQDPPFPLESSLA